MTIAPVARTAMDSKGSRALNKYYKDVSKMIDGIAPWIRHNRRKLVQDKDKVKAGSLVVKLGPGEKRDFVLYREATIINSKQ